MVCMKLTRSTDFCVSPLPILDMSKSHLKDAPLVPDVAFPNILTPYFRTPMTDLMGGIYNHQQYGKCGKFELQMMECLEAYGSSTGRLKCSEYIEDFNECRLMTKQFMRYQVRWEI